MASVIQPGQFVFINVGSTNLAAALSLPESICLTVATYGPTIAAVLVDRKDLRLTTIVGDLVVEEDAPKQVALGFEARGIRIDRGKSSNY